MLDGWFVVIGAGIRRALVELRWVTPLLLGLGGLAGGYSLSSCCSGFTGESSCEGAEDAMGGTSGLGGKSGSGGRASAGVGGRAAGSAGTSFVAGSGGAVANGDSESGKGGESGEGGTAGGGPECGDGSTKAPEQCDDANSEDGDGCSGCRVEPGFRCDSEPSVCEDVDECDQDVDTCSENATCANTRGSFECDCQDASAKDGVPCASVVRSIGAGMFHTCVAIESGAVRCWGTGHDGVLGYGNVNSIGDDETPATAGDVGVGGTVQQITASIFHTCALMTTGAVRCWGYGVNGRLGYGNTDSIGDDELPASVGDVDVGGSVRQVAAGGNHTCALLTTGAVRCWGNGALGYGNVSTIGDDEVPASAGDVNVGGTVQQIAAGFGHACALLTTGSVRCWGRAERGQLGYANTTDVGDDETPASVGDVDVGGVVQQIAAGYEHTCALLSAGTVRCWGLGARGRLGYASTNNVGDDETPAAAGDVDVGGKVQQITAGFAHTCALMTTGAVRCWGLGTSGQLGLSSTNDVGDDEIPATTADVDAGGALQQIESGAYHVCGIMKTGPLRCWGQGDSGALGYGNSDVIGDDETPASAGNVAIF
jgi:cysteine-rich repeat protein